MATPSSSSTTGIPEFIEAVKSIPSVVGNYLKAGSDTDHKVTGNDSEASQLNQTNQSESTQASNAGKQAQSSDHMNSY